MEIGGGDDPGTAATLKWRTATAVVARSRFVSSMRRLRYANLAYTSQEEGRSEDCSASLVARKDGSHRVHRVAKVRTHRECG
jgi:hypothetical protein